MKQLLLLWFLFGCLIMISATAGHLVEQITPPGSSAKFFMVAFLVSIGTMLIEAIVD